MADSGGGDKVRGRSARATVGGGRLITSTRTDRHTLNPAPPMHACPSLLCQPNTLSLDRSKQGVKKGGATIRDLDAEEGDAGVSVAALSVKDEVGDGQTAAEAVRLVWVLSTHQ